MSRILKRTYPVGKWVAGTKCTNRSFTEEREAQMPSKHAEKYCNLREMHHKATVKSYYTPAFGKSKPLLV